MQLARSFASVAVKSLKCMNSGKLAFCPSTSFNSAILYAPLALFLSILVVNLFLTEIVPKYFERQPSYQQRCYVNYQEWYLARQKVYQPEHSTANSLCTLPSKASLSRESFIKFEISNVVNILFKKREWPNHAINRKI